MQRLIVQGKSFTHFEGLCVPRVGMNAEKNYRFYAFTHQKLGKSASKICQELTTELGDQVPSLRTIQRWLQDATEGTVELSDAARSGRPRTSKTDELTALLSKKIEGDRRCSEDD